MCNKEINFSKKINILQIKLRSPKYLDQTYSLLKSSVVLGNPIKYHTY